MLLAAVMAPTPFLLLYWLGRYNSPAYYPIAYSLFFAGSTKKSLASYAMPVSESAD